MPPLLPHPISTRTPVGRANPLEERKQQPVLFVLRPVAEALRPHVIRRRELDTLQIELAHDRRQHLDVRFQVGDGFLEPGDPVGQFLQLLLDPCVAFAGGLLGHTPQTFDQCHGVTFDSSGPRSTRHKRTVESCSASPSTNCRLDQMRGAAVEGEEPARKQPIEDAIGQIQMVGLEPVPAGEERQRRHALEGREIREAAVGANESARTSNQLRLQLQISVRHGVRIDDEESRVRVRLEVAVLVETHRGAEQRDRRLPADAPQRLRRKRPVLLRVGEGLAEIELRDDVVRRQAGRRLGWRRSGRAGETRRTTPRGRRPPVAATARRTGETSPTGGRRALPRARAARELWSAPPCRSRGARRIASSFPLSAFANSSGDINSRRST